MMHAFLPTSSVERAWNTRRMSSRNRVAIVTGAAQGIGLQIASAFAKTGANIVLASRSADKLTAARDMVEAIGHEALAVATDLRNDGAIRHLVERTLERFGRIDVLVNNSGIAGPTKPLWDVDVDEWDDTFAVNVRGGFLCSRAVLPPMMEAKSGSIVFIGSMTGKRPLWGRTPYSASKLALVGLVRTLALEAGPHGIRVNLISPGPVAGERIEAVIRNQSRVRDISVDQVRRELLRDAPLGRFVAPVDVASAAVFLAGDEARSITGEDLNVSGGIVMY